jgi:hypothetical protein
MRGITRERRWGTNSTVGIGYIVVPFGVDRDRFVKSCYRKQRVHIALDFGGTMYKNCYIDSRVLQEIKFPEESRELGSRVVYVMDKFNAVPVIVALLERADERVVSGEESFAIHRSINGGDLYIKGNGNGKIFLNLSSTKGAKMKINVSGEDSVLEVNNEGSTTLYTESDINLNSSGKVTQNFLNTSGEIDKTLKLDSSGLKYIDGNDNKFFIDFENGTINHNEGTEPIPLGNKLQTELNNLKEKLNTFLDTFVNTPAVPSDGGETIQTAVKIATALKEDADFDNINSEKSFID